MTKEYDKHTNVLSPCVFDTGMTHKFLGCGDAGKENGNLNLRSQIERTRNWSKLNDLSS